MSAMSGLRQTYPPPEVNGAEWSRQYYAPAPAAVATRIAAPDSVGSSGDEEITLSDEQRSDLLSQALAQSGFVLRKVRMHFVFTEVLESMWANFGFTFSGNFAEGWGYSLYAMNGRPGFDSSVTYKFILPGHVVHCDDCACPDKRQLTCHVSEKTGTLKLSQDAIPIMKEMGLVVSMDGEVMSPKMIHETKQKLVLSRSSANPEVHFTEQLTCCPHFTRRVVQSLTLPADLCDRLGSLDTVRVSLRPRQFVFAGQNGRSSGKSQQPQLPSADPDFSGLERVLFQRLSEEQGQLYLLLKYLLLEALPQMLLPDRTRPFTELHCRQLLWHLLSRRQPSGQASNLIGRARQGLQLLAELLSAHAGSHAVAMGNYFDPRLTVQFAEAAIGSVDRGLLCRILSSGRRLLSRHVDAYLTKLAAAGGGGGGGSSYFVFRPLLMTIPGSSRACSGSQPVSDIADYPCVGFKLHRALDILLDEGRPSLAAEAELTAIAGSLSRCATTAAACLRALMALKTGQGAGMAQQALLEGGGQISVTDCFELRTLTPRMVAGALLKTDCAWLFRCKLEKDESEPHNVECHSPHGTAFLAGYPLIRFLFFPARQKPILHSERCCFEYRLRINFVALWHSLRSQLGRDWGSCVLPNGGLAGSGWGASSQEAADPQELLAQVLTCTPAPTRAQLLAVFQALVDSSAPFHRDRARDEWRWLNLVRLHLMGAWLDELRPAGGGGGGGGAWTAQQRSSCCELVDWCGHYEELFQCVASGCGVSAMLHSSAGVASEMQARSMLQSLLETEMEHAFPLTPESGCDRDLLVMRLYARHWSERKARANFEKRMKVLATH